MNKKQLIREVARITKFSIRLSKIIVNCCIKTILSELQQGHRISLKTECLCRTFDREASCP